MDKIASTVGAEWKKTIVGYDLERTPEIVDKLQQQELNQNAKEFTNFIKDNTKLYRADKELTEKDVANQVHDLIHPSEGHQLDPVQIEDLSNFLTRSARNVAGVSR
jgi:hypothetical protein